MKSIPEKMLKAYFAVAEALNQDKEMTSSAHYFHRTKKHAFSIKAERLGPNGRLPGEEAPYQDQHTISRY